MDDYFGVPLQFLGVKNSGSEIYRGPSVPVNSFCRQPPCLLMPYLFWSSALYF